MGRHLPREKFVEPFGTFSAPDDLERLAPAGTPLANGVS
jgi:hypothetical protein